MRVPLSWLREYVDLPADVTARELATKLTLAVWRSRPSTSSAPT